VYILNKGRRGTSHAVLQRVPAAVLLSTSDITGNVTLSWGREVSRGQCGFEAELITPIAMEKVVRFAIREGGHTVGAGVVTEVIA